MNNLENQLAVIANKAQVPLSKLQAVFQLLQSENKYTEQAIVDEINWFFTSLGLDRFYFEVTPPETIAQHIESLFAGKLLAKASDEQINQSWETIHHDQIMFACHDNNEITTKIERRIDESFPDYRVRSYQSQGKTGPDSETHFRLYFLTEARFDEEELEDEMHIDINKIADPNLLKTASEETKVRYQDMVSYAVNRLGPVIKFVDRPDRGSTNILIAYQQSSTHSYFPAISDVLHSYGISSERAYIEHFKNHIVLYSIHIDESTPQPVLDKLRDDISLVFVLPRTALTPLFQQGKLTAQEVVYAYTAMKFVRHFLTRYSEEYVALASAFQNDPVRLGLLNQLKHRLIKDTFTEDRIFETIINHLDVVKDLYQDFCDYFFVSSENSRRQFDKLHNPELARKLKKSVSSEIDLQVLDTFLTFNRHILKTNFYHNSKVALSFRLDPSFLSSIDYPDQPYGIFFIVGSEFRGFHIRFRDIARGGIRIIRSGNLQIFTHNNDLLFHENYDLAHTQQSKNKDIAEGGSKGAILLSYEFQDRASFAFKKYIDSLLDLMLPNDEIVDYYQQKEPLFLGPDEGTADLMDWASNHARRRGYSFWKSFTTGKSVENGGIPHDLYGMTTHSVHQYVLGILEKERLKEQDIKKLQTGGPDGDLGSNEILISKDKTTSIVDGSGVLCDPAGINRKELARLAKKRLPVANFNRSKLSAPGFLVTIENRDSILPDNTVVENGFVFRNEFHLNEMFSADLFVPCGGRPASVHINNVNRLLDKQGTPRFRFIVEGANLFFSQEARLVLEKAGVVVFKDSSANKGGVTSSSLEVLVALALNDDEFSQLMEVHDGVVPKFYQQYVTEVLNIIAANARLEFECIWEEHKSSRTPRSILSDLLSDKINQLTDNIQSSSIWENDTLRKVVLTDAIPSVLLDKIGLDHVMKRVPDPYLRALFAAHLASHYVYSCGLSAAETQFVQFLQRFA